MTASIDSLKIRVPRDQVTVIEPGLEGHKILVNTATGDIEKEYKERSYKVEYDGISTYYGIEHQRTADKTVREFVVILFNSKLLKREYLDGITSGNVRKVYDELMSHQVIGLDYDDFLNGECTDVDIKKDLHSTTFDGLLKIMYAHAKPEKHMSRGCNVFDKKGNKGIEFGKRETATPAYPFLKVYHKGLELINNSSSFHEAHLQHVDGLDDLIRVETTVKNKKHFRRHGVTDTRLCSVLDMGTDKLNSIFENCMNMHFEKRTRVTTPRRAELSPTDQALLNSIYMGMEFGLAYHVIRHNLVNGIEIDRSKRRTGERLDGLYMTYVKGTEIDVINEHQERFLTEMGWTA